ncbi:uncharacterized protein [Venturia canescens]|uniref:uncharacterized protein n=1 Tax=Venturia canescens TaxID=32260 RepID=UPI001C9CE4BD|nr:uncharacterized protein LOC122415626 [Venturia canescens]
MFREVLTKSGRRILKAIKKLSTRSRVVKKSQEISSYEQSPLRATNNWTPSYPDPDSVSLSWSLPSLDTRSVDTYLTYVTESTDECSSMCCYCREHDENQRNENRENEMII